MTVAEIPRVLREGVYLTDGKRLVQVKRVLDDALTVEAGPTDAPEYTVISKADVGASWRIVEPPQDDGSTEAWLAERFVVTSSEFVIDARTRCGCGRCLASLDDERGGARASG